MPNPEQLQEGFHLTVQYTDDPELMCVKLRFIGEPTERVKELARKHLNRMNCARPVEIYGECKGWMPVHIDALLADALAAVPHSSVSDKTE